MDPWSAAALGTMATGFFNQRSANKQMRFQDVSSRTQYQRAVSDMKAAGLNPMLATKLGGNAAMSGASATMPDLGATINSAENLRQQAPLRKQEAKRLQLQNRITELRDIPAAEVKSYPMRIARKIVNTLETITDEASGNNVLAVGDDDIAELAAALRSIERKSIEALKGAVNGLDAGTTKLLSGIEVLEPVWAIIKPYIGE